MNDLEKYFKENTGYMIHKWHHFFDIYDAHFSRFRKQAPVILEIGVFQGGSLQMWKNYFGPEARIYAIDIDPNCKKFEDESITIFTGSQSDRKFLREVLKQMPPIDIMIDDGGHTMRQQIVSFEEIYPHVKKDGVYLCEDLLTSYWKGYGGGYKRRNTFIEYSKNWIDQLNAYHSQSRKLRVNEFTKTAKSVHYYDSVVVIEKGTVEPPQVSTTGVATIPHPGGIKKTFLKNLFNNVSGSLGLPYHID